MGTFLEKLLGRWSRPASKTGFTIQQYENDWRAAFQDATILSNAPRQLEEARNRMISQLGRIYEIYERLGRRYDSLLLGVIEMVSFCDGLKASEEIQAIHRQLLNLLDEHGVTPWSPQVGKPAPDGCERMATVPSRDLPPGYVKGAPA